MPISALPAPPSRSDPVNFPTRADAFLGALPTFQSQANALATDATNSANSAATSAAAAAASQSGAASSAASAAASAGSAAATAADIASLSGAPRWLSGTSYAAGTVVWSPINALLYRRSVGGGGTADPSIDPGNWIPVSPAPAVVTVTGTSYTATLNVTHSLVNASATTLILPASPNVGDRLWVVVANGRFDNVVARNGQPIMGLAEDMTIDNANAFFSLFYLDSIRGWRIL